VSSNHQAGEIHRDPLTGFKGVSFSGNVKKAPGTIVQHVSPAPPVYLVELLFSFKGIKRVEVPGARIHLA
jgi:hypothetical protein